jgi:hypothetical protein
MTTKKWAHWFVTETLLLFSRICNVYSAGYTMYIQQLNNFSSV